MKYLSKLWVRIVIAIFIGFLFAGGFTDIAYPLPTIRTEQGESGGVLYKDVFSSNPKDLLNNEQNSLVRFSETFAVASVVIFSVLSIPVLVKRKKA